MVQGSRKYPPPQYHHNILLFSILTLSSLLVVVVACGFGFGFGFGSGSGSGSSESGSSGSGGVGVGVGTKALIVVQQPGRLGKGSCFSEHNNIQYVAHSKQIENNNTCFSMFEREVSHLLCAEQNKRGKEGVVVALTKAVVLYTVFTMHHINSLGANTMLHSPRSIHTHTYIILKL